MSISPYFYFSNNILFDFPSSLLISCSWPGSGLGSIKRTILFVKWDGEERFDAMSQWCASVLLLAGKQGIILDADLTLFEWELSARFKWELKPSTALTGYLFLRVVLPWQDFFSWRKRPCASSSHTPPGDRLHIHSWQVRRPSNLARYAWLLGPASSRCLKKLFASFPIDLRQNWHFHPVLQGQISDGSGRLKCSANVLFARSARGSHFY